MKISNERLDELLAKWLGGKVDVPRCELHTLITALHERHVADKAIIDKLPKTADGVPVVPCQKLWYPFGKMIAEGRVGPWQYGFPDGVFGWQSAFAETEIALKSPEHIAICRCYSTREAAKAARVEKGEE